MCLLSYSPRSDDHISMLLEVRGDVSKEIRNNVLEIMAQNPQVLPENHQPVFSNILVPAPELPYCLGKPKCAWDNWHPPVVRARLAVAASLQQNCMDWNWRWKGVNLELGGGGCLENIQGKTLKLQQGKKDILSVSPLTTTKDCHLWLWNSPGWCWEFRKILQSPPKN